MIYLDHHAATPTCAQAKAAMEAAATVSWANPASAHAAGRSAKAHLEGARRAVAQALGAQPADIVFTSGGTEAINGLILGGARPQRVVTSRLEHPAVTASVEVWSSRGVEVVALERPDAAFEFRAGDLVAVQWVNHETGTIFDIEALAESAGRVDASVVLDATQALGRLPIDVDALGVQGLAVASHKIGGPSGAGALWIPRNAELEPVLRGGGQERGRRGGSPDLRAIIGFGAACEALPTRLDAMSAVAARRDRLEAQCVALGAVVNGTQPRVASATNVSFKGRRGEVLVAALDLEGLCVSFGAACSSGVAEPSKVIAAMHPDEPWRAESCVRLSLGPEVTDAEVEVAGKIMERVLSR